MRSTRGRRFGEGDGMNTIVRFVKAGSLPVDLREGIDPERTVRVTVDDDEGAVHLHALMRRKLTPDELRCNG